MRSQVFRRSATLGLAMVVAAATTLVGATSASAAPGSVELLAKSIGSTYTGPYAEVFTSVTKGTTATITLEVINHSATTGQYNLQGDALLDGTQFKVLTSSVNITDLIYGQHGYVTNALAPGKSQLITLQLVGPPTITKTSIWASRFFLDDLDGNELGETIAAVEARTTTTVGTANDDMYLSTSGGGLVGTDPSAPVSPGYSSIAAALGGTDTFTVRLQNNTATPTQIPFSVSPVTQISGPCGGIPGETPWALTVKAGTVDVTAAATGPGYITPVLAKGKFVNITVSLKVPKPLFGGCASSWLEAQTSDESFFLVANAAAT